MTDNPALEKIIAKQIEENRTILQLIGSFFYTERKMIIIEAYIVDNNYNLQPEVKNEIKSLKQPILKSLQKKVFLCGNRIENKK